MSDAKTVPTAESVSDFLGRVEDETRRNDCLAIVDMMRKAAQAEPVMWGTSIVGFGRYHYRYESGREGESLLIGFSPRKNDLTLYLHGFDQLDSLMQRLGKVKYHGACLYIKKLADVDRQALQDLIEASVQIMADKRVDQ